MHPSQLSDPLDASRELLDWTLLALLSEGPLHLPTLMRLVPRVTAPVMRPVGDVIARRANALFEAGYVFIQSRDEHPATRVLHLSPAGRDRLTALTRQRGRGRPTRHDDMLLTLKTCVLDQFDGAVRVAVIDALVDDRRDQLNYLRDSLSGGPRAHHLVLRCLARQVAELEREIGWLESVRAVEHERITPARLDRAS